MFKMPGRAGPGQGRPDWLQDLDLGGFWNDPAWANVRGTWTSPTNVTLAQAGATQEASPVEQGATAPFMPSTSYAQQTWGAFYGKVIPTGYGTRRVTGTTIWATPVKVENPAPDVFKRTASFAISFGKRSGGVSKAKITKLFMNGVLVMDKTSNSRRQRLPGIRFTVYNGTETQMPDGFIESVEGAGNVPGFRDHLYVVFPEFELTKFGLDNIPPMVAEINEFTEDEHERKDFTRIGPATTLQRFMYDARREMLIVTENLINGESLIRLFDVNLMAEIARNPLIDRIQPQLDPNHISVDQVYVGYDAGKVYALPHNPLNAIAHPKDFTPVYSGTHIQPNVNTLFGGSIIDDHGLLLATVGNLAFNEINVGFIDPVDGKLLAKTDAIPHADRMASLSFTRQTSDQYKDAELTQKDWRCAGLVSSFFKQLRLYFYHPRLLKEQGYLRKDGIGYGAEFSRPDYRPLPGTGDVYALVANPPIGGFPDFFRAWNNVQGSTAPDETFNFFYLARGNTIWRLHVSALRINDDTNRFQGESEPREWSRRAQPVWTPAVHVFEGNFRIIRAVIDPADDNLFCLVEEHSGGLGFRWFAAKIKTFRTYVPPTATREGTADLAFPVQEKLLWTGPDLPSPFFAADNYPSSVDQDYSSSQFVYRNFVANIVDGENYQFTIVDMSTGTYESIGRAGAQQYYPDGSEVDPALNFLPIANTLFDVDQYRVLQMNQGPAWITLDKLSGDGNVPLDELLQWAAEKSGYLSSEIQITGLSDEYVWGAYLEQNIGLQEMLNQLGPVFQFDWYESEGKIKIVKRTPSAEGVVARTFTPASLGPIAEGADGAANLKTVHRSPKNEPDRLAINYIDKDADFVASQQVARRRKFPAETTPGDREVNYTIPIIMNGNDVYRRAVKALYMLSLSLVTHQFRLPWAELRLEPTDVVDVDLSNRVYRIKLNNVVINADLSLSVGGGNYSTQEIEVDLPEPPLVPVVPTIADPGFSMVLYLDLPTLNGTIADGALTYWTALLPRSPDDAATWPGASSAQRVGDEEPELFDPTTVQPIWGRTVSILRPTGLYPVIDTESALRVKMANGDLTDFASITDAELRTVGMNLVAVGRPGRWEIIAFKDVAAVGEYLEFSTLMRGQYGTEIYCDGHTAATYFIPLINNFIAQHSVDPAFEGERLRLIAWGSGEAAEDGFVTEHTLIRTSEKYWAIAAPHVAYSGADLVLTWAARDRRDPSWPDDGDVDATDQRHFDIQILDANNAVLRNANTIIETYTYTAADQASDGWVYADNKFNVRIYQVAPDGLRGFARTLALEIE